ncbi:MAG: hypothetical protein Q9160_003079 [Pyrenula sp. 1 TL-2023]
MPAGRSNSTEAIYLRDGRSLTHSTTITSLVPLSSLPDPDRTLFKQQEQEIPNGLHILTTSSTVFYPQGGGQPSDVGSISPTPPAKDSPPPGSQVTFTVLSVRHSPLSSSILHLGHFTPSSPIPPPFSSPPPLPCTQSISPQTRHLHSRLHTAGHILGSAVALLSLPGITEGTRAMHFPGSSFVDFGGLIPGTQKDAIQAKCDELVARDLAVDIQFWAWEEAERRCSVKPGEMGLRREGEDGDGDGEVRAVEIEDAGAYPCGGTHVGRTGEVGRVVVRRISRAKGASKISYEVGERVGT